MGLALHLAGLRERHVELDGFGGDEAGIGTRHCEQRDNEQGRLHAVRGSAGAPQACGRTLGDFE